MPAAADLKPCSAACERNKEPIARALAIHFSRPGRALEIASGTGQHAVHFGLVMPHLDWHCSDLEARHPGIRAWLDEAGLPNVHGPHALDVSSPDWPEGPFEYVFSANSAHIMSWQHVVAMFEGVARVLAPCGVFALYGPFNRNGTYTSASNRSFDHDLQAEDPQMGLRDLEALLSLAETCGLRLLADHMLPANNQLLVFLRR